MSLTFVAVQKMAQNKGLKLVKIGSKGNKYNLSYHNDTHWSKITYYARNLVEVKEIIDRH